MTICEVLMRWIQNADDQAKLKVTMVRTNVARPWRLQGAFKLKYVAVLALLLLIFRRPFLHIDMVYSSWDDATALQTKHTSNFTPPDTKNATDAQVDRSSFCLEKRGWSGQWVQDWNYAKMAQINLTLNNNDPVPIKELAAEQLFQPTLDNPYRWATSWRWQDDTCPFQLATRSKFCQVLDKLDIGRIWIGGDSMNSLFTWSILAMMQEFNLTEFNLKRSQMAGFEGSIDCNGRSIPIYYAVSYSRFRLSLMKPEFIKENQRRTLILINIGLHLNIFAKFQRNFGQALDFLDSLNRTQDIIFWRTANPGHKDCMPRQDGYKWGKDVLVAPFESYSEYKKTETDLYWWDMMEVYNEYAQSIIKQRNANRTGARIRWFNIFNFTVLRRDGHVGGKDCLHYLVPGPIDWWVHMLYSNLLDLATVEAW
jgi:hypothetical protein